MSSSNAPAPPLAPSLDLPLTDASLQQRLAIGVTSQAGAKGSLTRLATNLPQLLASGASKQTMIREIQLAQLEMRKLVLVMQRQEHEIYHLKDQATANRITQEHYQAERAHVQQLRQQLATAQAQQSCKRDLEALAEFALQKYPVAPAQLQAELNHVTAQMIQAQQQLAQAEAEYKLRTAQVQNLLQSIMDLRQCLTEPVENLVVSEQKDNVETEHDMEVEPMTTEEAAADDALYTDL